MIQPHTIKEPCFWTFVCCGQTMFSLCNLTWMTCGCFSFFVFFFSPPNSCPYGSYQRLMNGFWYSAISGLEITRFQIWLMLLTFTHWKFFRFLKFLLMILFTVEAEICKSLPVKHFNYFIMLCCQSRNPFSNFAPQRLPLTIFTGSCLYMCWHHLK